MSQSPLEEVGSKRYSDGWRAVNALIREGSSWSGRERNVVYRNTGESGFEDQAFVTGLDFNGDGRAIAAFDYDRDGDLDLALKFRTGPQLRILRNDAPAPRTLTLELDGAVGARATLETNRRKLVRESRSGAGFYSQPTRKLHFGLEDDEQARRLEVRRPDGATQTVDVPANGGEYALRRGDQKLTQLEKTAPTPAPTANVVAPPNGEGVWLMQPIPAPEAGRAFAPSKKTLVNFWATWCPPCREELVDLTAHAADFDAAGVAVLPISVDDSSDRAKVDAFVSEIEMPFEVQMADDATVTSYTVLHRYITNYRRDMAIPTSFLVDEQGLVIKVYRGAAEAEDILADAQAGSGPAVPFPGRWVEGRPSRSFLPMATEMAARGQAAPARTLFEAALAQGEASADLYNNLAGLLRDQGERQRAAELLAQSLALDPEQVDARINLGSLLLEAGDTDRALTLLTEAKKRRPDDPLIHMQMGTAYFSRTQLADAERAYREAIRLEPERAAAHASLGSVLGAQGRFGDALVELEAARDLGEATAQLFSNLGALYMQLGKPEQGLGAFLEAAERHPDDYAAHVNLAMYYFREEDALTARRWIARAREIAPDQPEAPFLEAQLLYMEGRDEDARSLLELILEKAPDFQPAREMLEQFSR